MVGMSDEVFKKKTFFVFFMLEKEKQKKNKKWKKAKQPYKNIVFKGGHPKTWKWENGFLAKIAWHYLGQEGRKKNAFLCTLSVLVKNCFWTKIVKTKKTIKIVVSAEITQNQKWHLLFEKGVLWHGWCKYIAINIYMHISIHPRKDGARDQKLRR